MVSRKTESDNLHEIYKMLIGQLQYEGNLIWTRHQVFIVLNSIIFTAVSLSGRSETFGTDILIVYAASAFGMSLCVLWFLTAKRSEAYYRYWISQTREVEAKIKSSIPVFVDLHRAHKGESVNIGNETFRFTRIERFASIGKISRWVAIAFFIIWIGLAIFFSIKQVS
jgi:hypothetical protein